MNNRASRWQLVGMAVWVLWGLAGSTDALAQLPTLTPPQWLHSQWLHWAPDAPVPELEHREFGPTEFRWVAELVQAPAVMPPKLWPDWSEFLLVAETPPSEAGEPTPSPTPPVSEPQSPVVWPPRASSLRSPEEDKAPDSPGLSQTSSSTSASEGSRASQPLPAPDPKASTNSPSSSEKASTQETQTGKTTEGEPEAVPSPADEQKDSSPEPSDLSQAEEVPPPQTEEDSAWWWVPWSLFPPQWNTRFKAGLDGTEGNNQRITTRVGLDVNHKSEKHVWSSQLDYVITTSSGQQIENELFWEGRFERLAKQRPSSWFVHSSVEYDRFTAFDVRVVVDGGMSYYFVRDPDLIFKGRVAGGTSREFGLPGAGYVPEFSYGLELEWQPLRRHVLKAKTDVFSDVRDFSDIRATTRATWRVQVDQQNRMSIQLDLLNRYDSTPAGKKKYDFSYSLQLVWDL